MRPHDEPRVFGNGLRRFNLGFRNREEAMSLASPAIFDNDDDGDPIPLACTSVKNRPSVVNLVIAGNDDGEAPLFFKRAKTYVGSRPSAVNPVIVGNDDGEVPLCFKRASASVKNRPSVVNPVILDKDDYEAPRPCKRVTTFVKNRTWGSNSVIFDNDDDEAPVLSSKRASTSVKNCPTLSKQKSLEDLDRQMEQYHAKFPRNRLSPLYHAKFSIEESEGDENTQKSEGHAKSGSVNGGRPKKKHKGSTSVPAIEDTMFTGQKASQEGQQYSISRCLEVLHGMDDVSDEIKVLASDVLKDAASREFFLFYESRLRGLWLKNEVAKLGAQLPACK